MVTRIIFWFNTLPPSVWPLKNKRSILCCCASKELLCMWNHLGSTQPRAQVVSLLLGSIQLSNPPPSITASAKICIRLPVDKIIEEKANINFQGKGLMEKHHLFFCQTAHACTCMVWQIFLVLLFQYFWSSILLIFKVTSLLLNRFGIT